ncbi:MAG: hypothetical protein ACRDK7_15290, partial [Solirubrobacteraceae bacterium]
SARFTPSMRSPPAPPGSQPAHHPEATAQHPRPEQLLNFEGAASEEIDQIGDAHPTKGNCPLASELGTVKITSPLVAEPLEGHIFLAQPQCGSVGQPECTSEDATDGKLFGIYLEAEGDAVILKLKGNVSVNPSTGQITGIFRENPELPFSILHLEFFGGPRSPLVNPSTCGSALTTSVLTPFSGMAPAEPFSGFTVIGCSGSHFAPSFTVGSTSNQAGGYTPLSVAISRQDPEGELGQVTVRTPPGLLGMLAHVTLCPEPQATRGTCAPSSQIGEVTVSVGAGPEPYYVTGGRVYITGPYLGAPYGLSIVEPAIAGPYNLGNVIVRGTIHVDPHTAALTVTTEPLPTVRDGVLLQIKTVNVNINRPEFVLNPTNCNPMSSTGVLASTNGLSSSSTNHFQVTNCGVLAFKPKFSASTSAHTSKAAGASLNVKLSYPSSLMGTQANLKSVKVDLPKSLPSRLTTLQKACTAKQFKTNPAGCPSESVIGHAIVHTQLLPVPLEGPAYFVSNGGEAFPNLILVLQGYGVTVDLVGDTLIKNGITSSTFASTPDVPFESFELTLPRGKYSALAANGNLCHATKRVTVKKRVVLKRHGHLVRRHGKVVHVRRKVSTTRPVSLAMPTAFVGQNGAEIHESTPISVTGCVKSKVVKHKVKRSKKKAKRKVKKA